MPERTSNMSCVELLTASVLAPLFTALFAHSRKNAKCRHACCMLLVGTGLVVPHAYLTSGKTLPCVPCLLGRCKFDLSVLVTARPTVNSSKADA